jgi:hypothetical protein
MYQLVNENTFKHFLQDVLRSSGYDEPSMLIARNAVNYVYAMYLRLKEIGEVPTEINRCMRRLLAISHLTGRHSGSFETTFEADIRRIKQPGDIQHFVETLEAQELSDVFWTSVLPDALDKVNVSNPFWHIFVAAQKKLLKDSFLTTENKVKDMTTADVHHIFPKNYLVKRGYDKSQYNKIANFVYLRNDINIAVSDKAPKNYMGDIVDDQGAKYHSNLQDEVDVKANLRDNAIPDLVLAADSDQFEAFMDQRRDLMAKMIHEYYRSL